MNNTRFRIRPSVSIIPISEERLRYDFFQTNTRRTISIKFDDDYLVDVLFMLNGEVEVDKIIEELEGKKADAIKAFLIYLEKRCITEDVTISRKINSSPYRRVLNFLADFVPSPELFHVWENIQRSHVIIIGLGAMGSWITTLLSHSGIRNFTLVDGDRVEVSNLNRSLYDTEDIGKYKTTALLRKVKDINPESCVMEIKSFLESSDDVYKIINDLSGKDLIVINCADVPNVDYTSKIIGKTCMDTGVPFIISGGYNLHLSLLGPTIIPFETACYECIRLTLEEVNKPEMKAIRKLYRPNRNIGNLAPLAGISASFVVSEVLRVVAKTQYVSPAMTNKRGEYNFLTNKINYIELPRRPDCTWCGNHMETTVVVNEIRTH